MLTGTFDVESVKKDPAFKITASKANSFLAGALALNVTEATEIQAKDFRREARERRKEVETMLDAIVKPLKATVKLVTSLFDPTIKAYDDADKDLKVKLDNLAFEKIRAAAAENKRLQEEADKENKSVICKDIRALIKEIGADEMEVLKWINSGKPSKAESLDTKELSIFGVGTLEAIKEKLVDRAKKESPESSKLIERVENRPEPEEIKVVVAKVEGVRMIKKCRVVDEGLIPKQYWVIDRVKLDRDVKDGIPVPGAELYEVPSTAIN